MRYKTALSILAITIALSACFSVPQAPITPRLPTAPSIPSITLSPNAGATLVAQQTADSARLSTDIAQSTPTSQSRATLLALTPSRTSEPTNTSQPSQTAPTINPTQYWSWLSQCPSGNPQLTPSIAAPSFTADSVGQLLQDVLSFLNSGGTQQAIVAYYPKLEPRATTRSIQERDINGDGIPELLLTQPDTFAVFSCWKGQYELKALGGLGYHFRQPAITSVADLNSDSLPEVVLLAGDDRVRRISVVEWKESSDGGDLLVLPADDACATLYGPSWVEAQNVGNSGQPKLVIQQEIPIWTEYSEGLPWRKSTRYCLWKGNAFVVDSEEFAPPDYRFQAIQDGDRATLAGSYSKALDFYQQAIFSNKLDWWSLDRWFYEYSQQQVVHPTPIPSLTPDPAEYPALAAYARFRIMLLHVVQGHIPDATIVYRTLQDKFSQGYIGHAQAEMATAFWDEYQATKNIEQACFKAIEYATQHPKDVLAYLGNGDATVSYFGSQSLVYKPADVCPIR